MSCILPADIVAVAAVVGAPYIAVRRHWDEGERRPNETSGKADDGKKKAVNDDRQEAHTGDQSVAAILQGGSRELARLRDAVK